MNEANVIIGARQAGIILLGVGLFAGFIGFLFIPRLAFPIIYKAKQIFFVPGQGTISKIAIYESVGTERHSSGTGYNRDFFSAFYLRIWADFYFNGKPYSVEIKKYTGQHMSLQEAYEAARRIAPNQEIVFEYYYKKKVEMPDDINFLKRLHIPSQSVKQTAISFKVNPKNPIETSLSDRTVKFFHVAMLFACLALYIIPLSAAWFFLAHFGKWRVLAPILVVAVICINIFLTVLVTRNRKPDDFRLARKPHFSVILGPDYTYDQVKPFVSEE